MSRGQEAPQRPPRSQLRAARDPLYVHRSRGPPEAPRRLPEASQMPHRGPEAPQRPTPEVHRPPRGPTSPQNHPPEAPRRPTPQRPTHRPSHPCRRVLLRAGEYSPNMHVFLPPVGEYSADTSSGTRRFDQIWRVLWRVFGLDHRI